MHQPTPEEVLASEARSLDRQVRRQDFVTAVDKGDVTAIQSLLAAKADLGAYNHYLKRCETSNKKNSPYLSGLCL